MLELAVLGLLAEQPRHGYDLKKRLSETLGPLWGISFGSLYPALRRLERSGAIEEVDENADRRRARGTLRAHRIAQGRPRRGPYAPPRPSVAPDPPGLRHHRRSGRALFTELLTDESDDDERAFAVKLLFCGHLDPAARLAFLERRRAQLTQRLVAERKPATRTIDRYSRSLLEHRARSTQHDLDWIAELIAQEREEQSGDRTEGATA